MSASREADSAPVMESKPADVFAFAMFTVEVFSGREPFEGQRNEAVMQLILQGGRPEMPGNAQVLGLTDEMWKLVQSCWQQNPEERPTIGEVVGEWGKFVERKSDDNIIVTECVHIAGDLWFHSQLSLIDVGNLDPWQNPHRALADFGEELRLLDFKLCPRLLDSERNPGPFDSEQNLRPPDPEWDLALFIPGQHPVLSDSRQILGPFKSG